MSSILYPLCAALAWIAVFYRLPRLRQHRDSSLVTLCAAFVLLALTFTISTPVVWLHIDQLAGYPNLSALLSQGCVLIFTATLQVLLLFWLNSRADAWAKIRLRSLAFGLALAVMVTLFLTTPTTSENPTDFAASYAGQPSFAAYLLLYVAAFAVMQIEVFQLCVRYARSCERPWLRRGLRITTVGAMFGLLYCLARTADVAGALAGLNPLTWETLPRLGAGGGEVLYLIGWTMPSWGPRMSDGRAWIASYRAHRRLYPLWAALYQLTPQIVLDPPRSRMIDLLDVRDMDFRLHRRVVEIQDGRLALRPYLSTTEPSPHAKDGAYPGNKLGYADAATETVQLRMAMDAKARNMPPADSVAAHPPVPPGPGDFAGELKWLIAVARAFSHSVPARAAAVTSREDHTQNAI